MKKIYKLLSIFAAGALMTSEMKGQAFTESFASVATLTTTGGWAQQNLSTPIGTNPTWNQGDGTTIPAFSGAATECAYVNYNSVAGANTISNWLFTPTRTFSNGDIIKFYTRTTTGSTYADRLQLRLSLNGASVNAGTTNTSVGDFTTLLLDINPTLVAANYPSAWTQYTVAISGLASPTSGKAAFRYFVTNGGPSGANSNIIALDDFEYIPAGASSPNVTVGKFGEYTSIPLSQVTPMVLSTNVNNIGTASTSNAMLTVNVFKAPNFTTPVQSYTSSAVTIAAGSSVSVNAGTYTPTTTGDYVCKFISSCTGNTITSADTSTYAFSVDNKEYARDNGSVTASFGIGAGPVGYIGSMYTLNTAATMDSVLIGLVKKGTSTTFADGVGDSTRVTVYNVSAGLPSTIIGKSPAYVFTPADTLGLVISKHAIKNLSGGPLVLSPGVYFVAITEYKTNVGVAVTNDIFKTSTVFAGWTGQAFTPVENFGANFAKAPVIRPSLFTCVTPTVTVNSGAVCIGSSFTMTPSGAVTYTYSNGSAIVTPTATTSYTVTGDDNGCVNTAVSTVSVNTLPIISVNSGTICAGTSFTMVPTGAATYTYSNGSSVATPTANATYSVSGTDANGCVSSTDAVSTITVNALPVLTAVTNNTLLCVGQTATLSVSGATTYTWSTTANTPTVAVSPTVQTTYTVNGTDANGCSNNTTVTQDVTTCTGIATVLDDALINLYPNPNNGLFTLELTSTSKVTVMNALGQVLISETFETGKHTVNINSESTGVYFVKVMTNNKQQIIKVIKD